MTNFNPGPSSSSSSNDQLATQAYVASAIGANLGLTTATQTLNTFPVENQSLASGNFLTTNSGSQNVINLINGPGILTQFNIILFTSSNALIAKGLLFTFTVDAGTSGQYTIQFDGDLWGCSQLPSNSTVPSTSTPYVWECDHLICLFGKDGSNDAQLELIFKYPIPFSSSLTLTIQNQSYTGGSFAQVWVNYAAQMGVSSPRRLQSSYVNANTPNQIPSAAEWVSNYTTNGGYLTGGLVTNAGALYQCSSSISGGTTAPPSDGAHWSAVSISSNPNFNTGYTILSVNQPCWLAHLSVNGQGPVNGGTYGSANLNSLTFLESNLAVYDGNLIPGASFAGSSPTAGLIFNSTGTEDFMGGSFYWATIGDVNSVVNIAGTPVNFPTIGKTKQLRHGYIISAGSAFMAANVDLLALHSGGIKCATNCLLRWEEGNNARAASGPIVANNTWKINPTVLYYT